MLEKQIIDQYFAWLCDHVADDNGRYGYNLLLRYLFTHDFVAMLDLDENRAGDGIELRYRFGNEMGYPDAEISNVLDSEACSLLEMMVALAVTCEEHIMEDKSAGDRTARWFWDMIENLGLSSMYDSKFDICQVDEIIGRFLSRTYERDGSGGLVTIHDRHIDMRNVEIWYQMMYHLSEVSEN